jgi:hypothetical protein
MGISFISQDQQSLNKNLGKLFLTFVITSPSLVWSVTFGLGQRKIKLNEQKTGA